MNSQVEEVKSKTDIVSIIGEYLDLKKAGRNYKANCPFHGEKTPSFMVSPELQIFKCFGCSASGDIFTFLERQEGMEFGEALKYLAEKAGIKLVSNYSEKTSDKEKIIEINESALNFYQYVLAKHPQGKKAYEYLLNERKLSEESIKTFKLGFAPDSPSALPKYLTVTKKYKAADLDKAGLIARGRSRIFDRFGGRIIFPLLDHRGEVIGFAGRLLPWDKRETGKYINSPETSAYHKSKVLYGLNFTKSDIKAAKFAVIVEGELDMISSWQGGVKNVVAIKGSALTEDQIRLLSRFTGKIVLCLDSDFAGDEAAKRGAVLAVNLGMEVKVATLEGYKDPDEAAKGNIKVLESAILNAADIWDFLIDRIFDKNDLSGSGKAKISKEVMPLLAMITDSIVQAHYIESIARRLGIPSESVFKQLAVTKQPVGVENLPEYDAGVTVKSRKQILEERLLALYLLFERKKLLEEELAGIITTPFGRKVASHLRQVDNLEKLALKDIFNYLPAEIAVGFSENLLKELEMKEIAPTLKQLSMLQLKENMEELGIQIADAERKGDDRQLNNLQKNFAENAKKLSALEDE